MKSSWRACPPSGARPGLEPERRPRRGDALAGVTERHVAQVVAEHRQAHRGPESLAHRLGQVAPGGERVEQPPDARASPPASGRAGCGSPRGRPARRTRAAARAAAAGTRRCPRPPPRRPRPGGCRGWDRECASCRPESCYIHEDNCMHITLLHNADADALEEDPGREARADVERVAAALADALGARRLRGDGPAGRADAADIVDPLGSRPTGPGPQPLRVHRRGRRGEMAVPCLLDLLGLPYSGSGGAGPGAGAPQGQGEGAARAPGAFPRRPSGSSSGRRSSRTSACPSRSSSSPRARTPRWAWTSTRWSRTSAGSATRSGAVLRTFQQPALVEQFIPGPRGLRPAARQHAPHRAPADRDPLR